MSTARTPFAARAFTSPALANAVGLRPTYRPSLFAFAMPSRCRSNIIVRSNSATLPSTLSMSLPVGVPVSRFMARTQRSAGITDRVHEFQQVAHGPCEAIKFRDKRCTRDGDVLAGDISTEQLPIL